MSLIHHRGMEGKSARIRRLFAAERDTALTSAWRIYNTVVSCGRGCVNIELGEDDAAELVNAYVVLKTFILTLDPNAEVPPELPES